jgi:quercetin dioxygenase-like cupin family protein
MLGAAIAAGMLGQQSAEAQGGAAPPRPGPIFEHDLPAVALDGWSVTAVELRFAPGAPSSAPHRHPGFVLGYVIEGAITFQLEGGPKQVLRAGEMFYEPPGSVHVMAGNASSTEPARALAMVFAEKGVPRSMPA